MLVISSVIKGRLFLSSYAPLFAIIALRVCPRIGDPAPLWSFVVSAGLAGLGVVDGAWLLASGQHRAAIVVTPVTVEDQGPAVAGYLPTYLLPFIGLGHQSTGAWIGYGIYIAVLFVVFLNSDFALVNPTLYLLGRRVTRVVIDREHMEPDTPREPATILVVSRSAPEVDESLHVTRLAGCWVEKTRRSNA
jgi:hypothetical protein